MRLRVIMTLLLVALGLEITILVIMIRKVVPILLLDYILLILIRF